MIVFLLIPAKNRKKGQFVENFKVFVNKYHFIYKGISCNFTK